MPANGRRDLIRGLKFKVLVSTSPFLSDFNRSWDVATKFTYKTVG